MNGSLSRWRRLTVVLGATLALVGSSLMVVSRASAANGDILRTITAQNPSCGVGTGLAFDGKQLLLDCWGRDQIWGVSPADGALLNTYTITGVSDLRAMAWDRGRNQLWACNADADVYLVDLASQSATFKFTSQGCVDGLAYDGSDDTIWSSDDAAPSVQHYKTDGTLIDSKDVSGLLGGICGNSGIAVGGTQLLLSNNGCSQIYLAPKTLDSATLFGSFDARLEDLECDDLTFAGSGKAAIWSKDAYDNILNAFELNPGDCGFGGFPAVSDHLFAEDAQEPSLAVNPTDPQNVIIGYNKHLDDGKIQCAYKASLDGGRHWQPGNLTTPSKFQGQLGDPWVSFFKDGTAYLSCLVNGDGGADFLTRRTQTAVVVASSTTKGLSFSTPTVVASAVGNIKETSTGVDLTKGVMLDQEAISGALSGTGIAACWTEFSAHSDGLYAVVKFSQATDKLATQWSKPVTVSDSTSISALNCTTTTTATGRVWVGWSDKGTDLVRAAYRDANGKRFSKPVTLGIRHGDSAEETDLLGNHVYLRGEPVAGSNRVAAVWASMANGVSETMLNSTADTTWGKATRISDEGVSTREPALDWGSDGKLAVGFYTKSGDKFTYNTAHAALGEKLNFRPVASAASTLESSSLEPFTRLGDFTSVAESSSGLLWAAWTDDRNGFQEVWFVNG